jgi:hypothetical protein
MSTVLSNFELLFKPLTPGINADLQALGRRALQGYFLSLTNLESTDYTYTLEFRVSLPAAGSPATGRRDLSVAVVIIDVAGDNQFLNPTRSGSSNLWTAAVTVPAGKTALVVLLPNVGLAGFFAGSADIEVRGHVSVALNCRFVTGTAVNGSPTLRIVPQATAPVRVLVNAEHRSTFLPNGWPAAASGALDFDQVGTSVALAQGRAEVTIAPRTVCFTLPTGGFRPATMASPISTLSDDARLQVLVEALALLASRSKDAAKQAGTLAKQLGLDVAFSDS